MTSYTNVFNDNNVNPAAISLAMYNISSKLTLTWPNALSSTTPYALMNEVTATAINLTVALPDATQGGVGYSGWFRNTGTNTFTVTDAGGNTIISIPAGQLWAIILRVNTTTNGNWFAYQIGSVTTTANAAALAGFGLVAITSTLNTVYTPVNHTGNYTVQLTDRASMQFLGSGSFSFTMPAPGSAGSGWYVAVKNSGPGTLTISPNSSETIDGGSSIQLLTEESCILMTDGTNWYTLGRGRILNYSTSKIVVALPASGTVTLSASQSANQLIQFTGTLSGNVTVIVPSTVQVYYIENMATGGPTVTVSTLSGTGTVVTAHTIVVCDGVNVNPGQDSGIGTITGVSAGTGLSGGGTSGVVTLSLGNTTVSTGSFGGAASIPTFTVNQQGQLTAASAVNALMTSTNIATNAISTSNIVTQSITNALLAPSASLTIKSNISGSSASDSDNSLSSVIDASASSVQGSVLYRGNSFWTALAPGTSGQFLETLGASSSLQWTTPTTAAAIFTQTFTTPAQTITSGSPFSTPHTLGVIPTLVYFYLQCLTAEHGYNIGDIVIVNPNSDNTALSRGFSCTPTSSGFNGIYGGQSGGVFVVIQSGGTSTVLTNANWNFFIRAWA